MGWFGKLFSGFSGAGSRFVVRLLGLLVLALFVAIRFTDPDILQNIRQQSFDVYQQIKPREYSPQPVTIIDIDEQSLREVGQWPWPRTTIAELITKLTHQGAVVIAFDVLFAEKDRLSPAEIARQNEALPANIAEALNALPSNETAMAQAMRASRIVLAQSSVRQADRQEEGDATTAQETRDAPHARLGPDPTPYMQKFPQLVQNLPELEEAATGRGVITFRPESDGIVRRVPMTMLVGGKVRLSLSMEALRIATGGESFAIRTNAGGLEGVIVARTLIKTDANGLVWPYYRHLRQDRYLPASTILNGTADPAMITGHIILIGTSAVGLEDYRPIPLGSVPGVEVHAQVIENVRTDTMLNRWPLAQAYEILTTAAAALLIILVAYRLSATWAIVIALVMMGAALASSWWNFASYRILYDATWPMMTFAAVSATGILANYIREEQQRQQVTGAFGQYLSPALVEQLADNPAQLELGGESRELTVLFTDVRGFTTISESYRDYPEGLTKLMNIFLTELSAPILAHDGTIDKYMGDAIMAFWNAPVDEPDHAIKGGKAALQMIASVAALNARRKEEITGETEEEYHEINVGIGINTGLCVVGNMGSDKRFDYTALGDTVNLASRLEGQSKPYGLPIVIGDATAMELEGKLATFEIDLIRVKGKNEPVRIHCLTGDETMLADEDFIAFRAMNRTMISAYRTREWDTAFDALEKMEELGEKLGIPIGEYSFIYETRIAEFRANPPGRDWDGVYTAISK